MSSTAWEVALQVPAQWDRIAPEVVADLELLRVLGFPASTASTGFPVEDVVVMAVLSERIDDDEGQPVGALMASLVAMLAPPSPNNVPFPIVRREPLGPIVDGEQAWAHVVTHRASFPEINCDLLMEFSTPNLPLVEDLEPLFARIAATAVCRSTPQQ